MSCNGCWLGSSVSLMLRKSVLVFTSFKWYYWFKKKNWTKIQLNLNLLYNITVGEAGLGITHIHVSACIDYVVCNELAKTASHRSSYNNAGLHSTWSPNKPSCPTYHQCLVTLSESSYGKFWLYYVQYSTHNASHFVIGQESSMYLIHYANWRLIYTSKSIIPVGMLYILSFDETR